MTTPLSSDGKSVLRLQGMLVLKNLPRLRAKLDSVSNGSRSVLLDLSAIEDMDMSGVSWLMQANQRFRRRGGRLSIVDPSASVRQALRLLAPATALLVAPC